MMRRIILVLLLTASSKGQTVDFSQKAESLRLPPPEEEQEEGAAAAPTTCSCEEHIRHLNSILVEKERLCEESKQISAAHCNDRIQFAQEDAQQAHAALQEEIAKLHSTVLQIREQKDSIHRNCEQSVSEAYAKGWKVAETEYQSQVKAKDDVADQLRSQHLAETRRLGTVINHIHQQTEEKINECEDRYREIASSLNKWERKDRQQLKIMEQQLSSAQMVYRAQLEYLLSEKTRLEEENRSLRQRSSRCLQAFLDIQRQKVKEGERLSFHAVVLSIWKSTVYTVESCWNTLVNLPTYAWESIFNAFLRLPWERYGQKYAQKQWPLVWDRIRFVSDRLVIHGPLLMGMLVDGSKMLVTEIILIMPELPDILPAFLVNLWESSAPIRENASQLMGVAKEAVFDFASPTLAAFSINIAEVWQEICRVLYRKDMDPYIRSTRNEIDRIRQASTPYIDRTVYVLSEIKKDLLRALVSFHQFISQTSKVCWVHIQLVHRSVQTSKGACAVKFSDVARTLLLFLRVYNAPKIIIDALEYCQEKPIAALDDIGLVLLAMLGLSLLLRIYFSRSRKPRANRKVCFAFGSA